MSTVVIHHNKPLGGMLLKPVRTQTKIGILFTVPQETQGFVNILNESWGSGARGDGYQFWYAGNLVILAAVSGPDNERSSKAADNLIDNGARAIVSAGFAYALDADIGIGDVIIAESVHSDEDGSVPVISSPRLASSMPPEQSLDFPIHRSKIITTNRPPHEITDHNSHYRRHNAIAVDTGSYASGRICEWRNVPFTAVRSIVETPKQRITEDVRGILNLSSSIERFGLTLTSPRLWPKLYTASRRMQIASDHLAEVLSFALLRFI